VSLGPWRRIGCDDDDGEDDGIDIMDLAWTVAGLATAACGFLAARAACREAEWRARAAEVRLAAEIAAQNGGSDGESTDDDGDD
jgi:hypothetical protein